MKDKLITRWHYLNWQRFEVDDAYIWPLMAEMDRIQHILAYRYYYFISYSKPANLKQ